MDICLLFIAFIIAVIIISVMIFKPVIRNKKICNGIRNTDMHSKNYLFSVNAEQEVLDKLSIPNCQDVMEYTFDKDNLQIVFTCYNTNAPYSLSFISNDENLYLKVECISVIPKGANIPYLVNEFFINKVNAKPVEYETL